MEKGQILELTIEDLTEDGSGIGKADGYPIFVKDTVPGDRVRVTVTRDKKRYAYARLSEVLAPSPDRVPPRCPLARACGGCQLQELAYPAQLDFKRRKIEAQLARIGGFAVARTPEEDGVFVEPVLGMEEPYRYRNKVQVPVGTDRNGRIVTGYYAGRTHSIVPHEHCLLARPGTDEVLAAVRGWMEHFRVPAYNEKTGSGLVRHVLVRTAQETGATLVCLVVSRRKVPHSRELVQALRALPDVRSVCLNIQPERSNVILGRETVSLSGEPWIEDRIGTLRFRISPQSFFQVNPLQTRRLYGAALELAALSGRETVWDLYCGIGTISLFLAQRAGKVIGVESVAPAVEDARENARRNGVENASFLCGKAEEVLPRYFEETGERADVIVVDPPRKGCDPAVLSTMLAAAPARIVYVSCNSSTLARDLRILADGGYSVRTVRPVDMFPQSAGVETVCCLYRKKEIISVPFGAKDAGASEKI